MRKIPMNRDTYYSLLRNPKLSLNTKKNLLTNFTPEFKTNRELHAAKKRSENREKNENPLWLEFKEIVENDFNNDERFTYKRRLKKETLYNSLNKNKR